MTEPAALDLARIRHTAELGVRFCEDRSSEMLRLLESDVPALVDELTSCRAERDALRAAVQAWVDWWDTDDEPSGDDAVANLRQSHAALGEVTP